MMFNINDGLSNFSNQRNQQFDLYGKDSVNLNGDYGGNTGNINLNNPLAHLNDSVNSLDPLNAIEKSLNEQVTSLTFRKAQSIY
jgi:zinc finger MIZ domain-containing protein